MAPIPAVRQKRSKELSTSCQAVSRLGTSASDEGVVIVVMALLSFAATPALLTATPRKPANGGPFFPPRFPRKPLGEAPGSQPAGGLAKLPPPGGGARGAPPRGQKGALPPARPSRFALGC